MPRPGRVCPVCETEVPDGAASCSYCKRVFAPGDFDPRRGLEAPPPESDNPPPPRRLAPYVYSGLAAVALAAGVLLKDTKLLVKSGQENLAAVAATAAPPPAPAVRARPPEPPPQPADGSQLARAAQAWTQEGRVFDAAARKPLADAELVFTDRDTKARFAARTDAKGRYRAKLAWTSGGYGLTMRADKENLNFMEDWIPSLLSMPAEKAAETAAELAARPPTIEDVFGAPGGVEKKVWAAVPGRKRPADPSP